MTTLLLHPTLQQTAVVATGHTHLNVSLVEMRDGKRTVPEIAPTAKGVLPRGYDRSVCTSAHPQLK